jgi:hypothetical protein
MELSLGRFPAMSLAFGVFSGDNANGLAQESVKKFAELNHKPVEDVKTYFASIVVTQHGVRNVTYLQYIEIKPEEAIPSGFRKTALPEGPCLEATLSAQEFAEMEDGTKKEIVDNYLKSHQLRMDIRNVLFLAEKTPEGNIHLRMPVK